MIFSRGEIRKRDFHDDVVKWQPWVMKIAKFNHNVFVFFIICATLEADILNVVVTGGKLIEVSFKVSFHLHRSYTYYLKKLYNVRFVKKKVCVHYGTKACVYNSSRGRVG